MSKHSIKVVKDHRHIRLVGQIGDRHINKIPREMIGGVNYDSDLKIAAMECLAGNKKSLMNMLTVQQQRKMFSYLNNLPKIKKEK